MKTIKISAKNIQKAIEEGLKELNATQDEVDIKILDEGGLFKKAVVELTLDKEVEEKKAFEDSIKEENNVELNNQNKMETEVKSETEVNKKDNTMKASSDKEEKIIKDKEALEEKNTKTNLDKKDYINCENSKEESSETDEEYLEKAISFGTIFLNGLIEKMNIDAQISAGCFGEGVTFNATGEKVNNLIGKRGETLNAIQEILSLVMKNAGFRDVRFYFDVENYKNRREVSLINLAERMASKAIKIKKPIKLERMSAYERKIIHSTLQNFEGVTTKSEGEEPNRYLVIFPSNSRAN